MAVSIVDAYPSISRESIGEAVCRRAQAILGKSPYLPLRTLQCNYEEGTLTLRGEVPTFYLKQLAQSLVSEIHCPQVNLIDVTFPKPRGGPR